MKKIEYMTLKITKTTHNRFKAICDKKNLKLNAFGDRIILSQVEKMEKEDDNIQNNKQD